jgi:hypothetical protein
MRFNHLQEPRDVRGMKTMKNMDERIATLEDKLRQLKARQQRADEKRKRLEAKQTKKTDLRRRLLVGTVVLEKIQRGELDDDKFRKWLDTALVRPVDRALFDL